MAEPALDVKASLRLVRRLWPWMAITCLIGAVAGASYELFLVTPYHASSVVLLPTSNMSTSSAGHATATTDASIAKSGAVLLPAARRAGSTLSLEQLQARVSTSASAVSVLKITAAGTSAGEAERLANAVADQLVVFLTTSGSSANTNAVAALESEVKQVNEQIDDVQTELNVADQRLASDGTSSPTGNTESQVVSQLTSERASLTLQLDSLKSQISEAQLEELSTNQGTEVIQRATTAGRLSIASFVLPAVLGAIVGLLLGFVAIVAVSRRDRRLRARDAIAEAVGAPVLFSMEERPRKSPKDWAGLFEHHAPQSSTQWHVRRGLRELGIAGGEPEPAVLHMLAFGDDDGAAAAAIEVALISASAWSETQFSIAGPPGEQAALRSVCARFNGETKPRPGLTVHSGLDAPPEDANGVAIDLYLLDRSEPEIGIPWRPQDAVMLVVSVGRVTAEDLARASIAVDEAGLRVGGVAVVNPASEDRTVGRFSEIAARRTTGRGRRPADAKIHVASTRTS